MIYFDVDPPLFLASILLPFDQIDCYHAGREVILRLKPMRAERSPFMDDYIPHEH